jgi:hypothetical protein
MAKQPAGRERMEQSFNATMRMDAVVDLASHIGSDTFEGRLSHLDQPLSDLVEDLLETRYKVHQSMEALRTTVVAACVEEPSDMSFVAEALMRNGLLGLVVKFVTPVMTKTGKHSHTFSWGYTQSTWVYADTYDEAWALGIAWALKCRKEAKPRKRAAAGAAA